MLHESIFAPFNILVKRATSHVLFRSEKRPGRTIVFGYTQRSFELHVEEGKRGIPLLFGKEVCNVLTVTLSITHNRTNALLFLYHNFKGTD